MRPVWYDFDGNIVQSIFHEDAECVEIYERAEIKARFYKEPYEDSGPYLGDDV